MRSSLDCMPCFIRQALETVRLVTDDPGLQERILREVLKLSSGMDLMQPPPATAQKIHQIIRELSEVADPYQDIKSRYNLLAMEWLPELRRTIQNAEDPFCAAVKLSIAGNIIDFGVNGSLALETVKQTIDAAIHQSLDRESLDYLRDSVQSAQSVLYLADNAGEIAFDRLLIECIGPEKVILAVKASPILNDALLPDAQEVGLTELVQVIDNGSNAPGTILEQCSESFRKYFETADLIISKGQGNYESLSDTQANIVFLFQAKCSVVANHVNKALGRFVVCRSDVYQCAAEQKK